MSPYYIQPGTPVYLKIITLHGAAACLTLHGFVKSDTGTYVEVVVPSMNNKSSTINTTALPWPIFPATPRRAPTINLKNKTA